MKRSVQNSISVVSILILFAACKSPEQYAEEWCKLNAKIESSEGKEKELLTTEAEELEDEIYSRFGNDPDEIQKIIDLTDECD